MKVAPVAHLKASLSRYLAAVKAGDELLVTERGKPIARIVPVSEVRARDPEERRLIALEAQGVIRRGSGTLGPAWWNLPKPADPKAAVRAALVEEREQGR